ncbi:MAG: hypothetical protein WC340_04185 [Kiritimatiellia bacterium]
MPAIVFHSGVIFVFSQAGAVVNFITNLLILPKFLNASDLGLVAPVTQFVAIGAIPLTVITSVVIKYITKYEANEEWGKLNCLVRDLVVFGLLSTIVIVILFIATFNSFAIRVGISSGWIQFWMLIYLCVSSWIPVIGLLARSTQRFFIIGVGSFVTPLALMVSSIIFLPTYGFTGYLVALVISTFVNAALSFYGIYFYLLGHKKGYEPYFSDCKPLLKKYLLLFSASAGIGWVWALVPSFVVKHFLSDQDAAGYFFIQRLSQLPFYAFSTLMIVLLPILSMKYEKKQSTAKTVKGSIIYTVLSGVIVIGALYFFSSLMFHFVPQWRPHAGYSPYIWFMAIYVTIASVDTIISADLVAKWEFRPAIYRLPVTCFFVIFTYCIFGWDGTKGYVPSYLWRFVDAHVVKDINLLISILIISSLAFLSVNLIWYFILEKKRCRA